MDDRLSKTDAAELAIHFCQQLDERSSGTTASHLRIVQKAIRDFAVAISTNVDERIRLLENKQTEIQNEIDSLKAGHLSMLSAQEQQERIREIYQLTSVLTGDFRRLEDEIRHRDKQLRLQMIEDNLSRGELLQSVLEKESILAKTDAGSN